MPNVVTTAQVKDERIGIEQIRHLKINISPKSAVGNEVFIRQRFVSPRSCKAGEWVRFPRRIVLFNYLFREKKRREILDLCTQIGRQCGQGALEFHISHKVIIGLEPHTL